MRLPAAPLLRPAAVPCAILTAAGREARFADVREGAAERTLGRRGVWGGAAMTQLSTEPSGPRPPQTQTILSWLVGGLLVIALCGFMLLAGVLIGRSTKKSNAAGAAQGSAASADAQAQFGALAEIYQTLQDNYVDPSKLPDLQTQKQAAIDGLLTAVGDTHQVYVNPQDVALESSDISGQFEGVGASVQQKNGSVQIEALIPDTPAAKSNLKVGDVILGVDGKSVQGKTVNDVVGLIRGQAGTNVTISVQHSGGAKEDVQITRASITLTSVHADQITDKAGNPVTDLAYIRIDQYQDSTAKELATALDALKGKGYKGLILDLRGNPGGLLDSCEQVLNDFLKPGDVELIQQARGGAQQSVKASSGAASTDLPLVVLVNKQSASASEITAGALQDHKRAVIIGEQTFGKGTVNEFFKLPQDGGELYVSIGRWLTPAGKQIEGQGITPDMVVPLDNSDDPQSTENAQLYAAIDYLHQHGAQ
jgi:carboxyl-terminal processing protease